MAAAIWEIAGEDSAVPEFNGSLSRRMLRLNAGDQSRRRTHAHAENRECWTTLILGYVGRGVQA
jgi:hypothetical protein